MSGATGIPLQHERGHPYRTTSLSTNDNMLWAPSFCKTWVKINIEVLTHHRNLLFPWKWNKGSVHHKRMLVHLPLSLPTLGFNELLSTLKCWDNLSFLSHIRSSSLGTKRRLNFSLPWTQLNFTIPGSQVLSYLAKWFSFVYWLKIM